MAANGSIISVSMNPILFQLNTRVTLSQIGNSATLDEIEDSFFDRLASAGFDWLWLLGVWSLGHRSVEISRTDPQWIAEYRRALPDLKIDDICGSPFAVHSYSVDHALGGDAALARLRSRLRERGIKLLLDFVPNHVALDHPWVQSRPDFFFTGNEGDLTADPLRWTRVATGAVLAYGRDPNYPGWPDTLQLNYFNPDLQRAMIRELRSIAGMCDGVRCDMAMLLEPEVFQRTWGGNVAAGSLEVPLFWPEAIAAARCINPSFLFIAEVYWDYEQRLLSRGFDYAYDKTLYDRLLARDAQGVRSHLGVAREFLGKLVHFLENHDEPRIASRLSHEEHRAAAVITLTAPGMRLIHDGQQQGKQARIPVHLNRGPEEKPDPSVETIYDEILPIVANPAVSLASWSLLDVTAAWDENPTHLNFVCALLETNSSVLLVAVNYAPNQGQCFVQLPERVLRGASIRLLDLLSDDIYDRPTEDLRSRGLYLDVSGWRSHIFRFDVSE